MKNPNAWVLGMNLLVYGTCYVLRPYFYFEYFFVFCGINVLIGILLLLLQKKALGQAFLLASFVIPLIGLGVCAIIISQLQIGRPH
jgi:hypothetical protein